ncbi:hypothetical protein GCM10027262_06840 [Nocardia tengchongensis]
MQCGDGLEVAVGDIGEIHTGAGGAKGIGRELDIHVVPHADNRVAVAERGAPAPDVIDPGRQGILAQR